MIICSDSTFSSFEKKCEFIKEFFNPYLEHKELMYQKIIDLGRELPPFSEDWKNETNQVKGCQSILYLHTTVEKDILYFKANSDALISAGLAALMIFLYSGEKAEVIINNPPRVIEELGIASALSISRANGLASLHLKIREKALLTLLQVHKHLRSED